MDVVRTWGEDFSLLIRVVRERRYLSLVALISLFVAASPLAGELWFEIGQAVLLGCCLLLLRWLGRTPDRIARRADDPVVWQDLTFAVIFWLAAGALTLLASPLNVAVGLAPEALILTSELLRALSYVGFYLAIERQPHRRHRWRPIELERKLLLRTAWLVALGLVVYFSGLPFFFSFGAQPEALEKIGPSLIFGGYLLVRLVYLVRVAGSGRWRPVYCGWVLSLAARLASDLLYSLGAHVDDRWPDLWLGFAMLSIWGLMLASGARRQAMRLPPPPPRGKFRVEENLPGPLGQTMMFLLIFPLMHYGVRILGGLDPTVRGYREGWIFFLLLALGGVAFFQHRVLFTALTKMRDEYSLTERRLHRVELDIRVQSRSRKERALADISSLSLARVFDSCPDAVALASLSEKRLLDFNEGFLNLFGFLRHEVLGRTLPELGVWSGQTTFEFWAEQAQEVDAQHFEAEIRRKSGRMGHGLFFLEAVEIEGQPYLLIMIRDVTRHQVSRQDFTLGIALLEGLKTTLDGLEEGPEKGQALALLDHFSEVKGE